MADIVNLEDWKDTHDEPRESDDPCIGCSWYFSCVNKDVCDAARDWAKSFYGKFKENHTVHNIRGA